MLLIIDFLRNSPSFWLFVRIKLAFSHLGLNPIATKTCIWSSISHTEGKVQIGKEPSLKYYLFLLLMYLHLFEIAVYLSLRTIEEQTEFQFAFRYRFFVFFSFRFSFCKKNGSKRRELIEKFIFPTYSSLSPSSTKIMTSPLFQA